MRLSAILGILVVSFVHCAAAQDGMGALLEAEADMNLASQNGDKNMAYSKAQELISLANSLPARSAVLSPRE